MSGFGMTAVLLEHAPIAKHPWLTSALVAEEVAIQEHAERTVFVMDDDMVPLQAGLFATGDEFAEFARPMWDAVDPTQRRFA